MFQVYVNKVDHVEASTPKTFKRYTLHPSGTSFGTKFEGLKISRDLPKQINGLFHAGSVGIIMSGWLGAANYGVIVANETDKFLRQLSPGLVNASARLAFEQLQYLRQILFSHPTCYSSCCSYPLGV